MKLLRTIRLDTSDTFVFERTAEPGEWAVSGAFAFWAGDPAVLQGKARAAFRSGFLGIGTLGWSTLVQIVEASAAERAYVVQTVAEGLVSHFGAPDMTVARVAAEDEVAFAESLCDPPLDTLVAVHRTIDEGKLRETFRTLRPRKDEKPARAFAFMQVEGEEESAEKIDLLSMARKE